MAKKSYKFSKTSLAHLNSCDQRLIEIMHMSLSISVVDFGISCGYRSVEKQKYLYASGRTRSGFILTNIDGVSKLSKHNVKPSMACDIFAYIDGKANYELSNMCYLAGVISAAAEVLGFDIVWGGNWDSDGIVISDQNFIDLPHFELVN